MPTTGAKRPSRAWAACPLRVTWVAPLPPPALWGWSHTHGWPRSEEPPYGSDRKPEEMYHIIEHFVLGRRRLELFGEDHNVRPGWVTVGLSLSASNFSPQVWPLLL